MSYDVKVGHSKIIAKTLNVFFETLRKLGVRVRRLHKLHKEVTKGGFSTGAD